MKTLEKISIVFITVVLMLSSITFAVEKVEGEVLDFSDEFKEWLNLSSEEKKEVIQPRPYEVLRKERRVENPLRATQILGNVVSRTFNLKDIIPENLIIRDQGNTEACWAFAANGKLETNLALRRQKDGLSAKTYDFSEMHIIYSTSNEVANNRHGLNRRVADGGFPEISTSYFTSGRGPIHESDMPFDDRLGTKTLDDISGKQVIARVYDTVELPSSDSGSYSRNEIKALVKNAISTYGGVEAAIHGANFISDYYNMETGALYCDRVTDQITTNHDILIVGWDDDYSRENFNEQCRPQNNGAWIIRNSWGERIKVSAEDIERYHITNYTLINGEYTIEVGKGGFMYVSYEDAHIYKMLSAIEKSTDSIDYDYIYQYNYNPALWQFAISNTSGEIYIANNFTKTSNSTEYLNEVSIETWEDYECEVYVNPNGTDKSVTNLVKAQLKAGNKEEISAGYHTLEFAVPIEITGNEFTVIVHAKGKNRNTIGIIFEAPMEINYSDSFYRNIEIEGSGKCFITTPSSFSSGRWEDCSDVFSTPEGTRGGDLTIKAFTTKTTSYVPPDPGTQDPVDPGTQDPTDPGTQDPTDPGTQDPTDPGTQDPTDPGAQDPTDPGAQDPTDPGTQGSTTPDPEAILTNFSNATVSVDSIKAYYHTNESGNDYMKVDLSVDNINRSNLNDTYTYYYYISTNANENNITSWVAITESQNNTSYMRFAVDTRDIFNYADALRDNHLYLYIKEVVTRGNSEKTYTTPALMITSNKVAEIYKDGVKQDTSTVQKETQAQQETKEGAQKENTISNSVTNKVNNNNDLTTSTKSLPNTGKAIHIIILMLIVSVIGIVVYRRYTKMDF